MVMESIPFAFPRNGRVSVHSQGRLVGVEFHFLNGYGASVIRHPGSHGGRAGLFELAVLDADGAVIYVEEIKGERNHEHDVTIGWLTPEEVATYLERIAAL